MARRTVGEEIRRVVARLGGTPAAHGVALPAPAVHDGRPPGTRAHPLRPGVPAHAVAPEPPGARIRATSLDLPEARPRHGAHRIHATPRATGRPLIPPRTAGVRPLPVPSCHAVASRPLPGRVRPVAVCHARPRRAAVVPSRVTFRVQRPLPRVAALHRPRPVPDRLFVSRRRRVAWDAIDRVRLASAWRRILLDHRLPAEELELVGVYGPLPLGLVEGVMLETDGRLALRLARRALAAPFGDMAIARHVPSGRLLQSAHPRDGLAGRVRH